MSHQHNFWHRLKQVINVVRFVRGIYNGWKFLSNVKDWVEILLVVATAFGIHEDDE